ncbi:MAG: hypothetical protein ACRYE9_04530 [Janthinobacterium lividum]
MIIQTNISFFIFIIIQLMLCTSSFAKNGLLIVGMGLPGSGKSTIMAELGKVYNTSHVFLEPEESTWPKFITEKKVNGSFTAPMWFRSTRVLLLIQADQLRNEGQIAIVDSYIVDSYYDKLLYQYIDNKNMG